MRSTDEQTKFIRYEKKKMRENLLFTLQTLKVIYDTNCPYFLPFTSFEAVYFVVVLKFISCLSLIFPSVHWSKKRHKSEVMVHGCWRFFVCVKVVFCHSANELRRLFTHSSEKKRVPLLSLQCHLLNLTVWHFESHSLSKEKFRFSQKKRGKRIYLVEREWERRSFVRKLVPFSLSFVSHSQFDKLINALHVKNLSYIVPLILTLNIIYHTNSCAHIMKIDEIRDWERSQSFEVVCVCAFFFSFCLVFSIFRVIMRTF